jgi:hypothetical protein
MRRTYFGWHVGSCQTCEGQMNRYIGEDSHEAWHRNSLSRQSIKFISAKYQGWIRIEHTDIIDSRMKPEADACLDGCGA